jgi:hypothetical protein
MGYTNPLLGLPAGKKLLALPAADRARIEAVMRELREQANDLAELSWKRRKSPMATYWRAVSTYARHLAHALSGGRQDQLPPVPDATDATAQMLREAGFEAEDVRDALRAALEELARWRLGGAASPAS